MRRHRRWLPPPPPSPRPRRRRQQLLCNLASRRQRGKLLPRMVMDGDARDLWHDPPARALRRPMHGRGALATLLLSIIALTGCVPSRNAPRPNEPIGLQLLRVEPDLRGQRFNALLTFEQP